MGTTLSISAGDLHKTLLQTHAIGNVARRRFADALRALSEQQLYRKLGFSTIVSYAETCFGYGKSAIYELLRVSEKFTKLEKIAGAFEEGKLSWNLASKLTRVATPSTEETWIEFAETHKPAEVVAEVKEAIAKGRTEPRKNRRGLPGLTVRVMLEFSAEEHAVVERGFEKIVDEMSESLDGERPSPAQAILYLMDRVLKSGSVDADRKASGKKSYEVVFHKCTECDHESVETSTGRVELPEGSAGRFIDGPNTPAIRRSLFQRSGGRCENPMCGRRIAESGHGHHIEFRSQGGRTRLDNLAYVCVCCHSNVHAGTLAIERDADGGWRWIPKAEDLARKVREELAEIRGIPQIVNVESSRDSGDPEKLVDEQTVTDTVSALHHLGFTVREARLRTRGAAQRLGSDAKSADLLREAFRTRNQAEREHSDHRRGEK